MIPLSVPNISGNEWQYIKDCLDTNWVSSVGSYVNDFERITSEYTKAKYCIATSNGTAALHISLILAGVGTDDMVIAPNITFVATINALKYTDASPILFDVDPETWQMDLNLVEDFLENSTRLENGNCIFKETGQRVKAIIPVHIFGNMCDMDQLLAISQKYHLSVVEDSTEALGSYFKGKHSGTFGLLGTISYNGNKLITTGGGGMILTNDSDIALRAKHLTTTAKRDGLPTYFHDEIGYNYRLVNILAAMGVAQMENLESFLIAKDKIKKYYDERLSKVLGFSPQKTNKHVQPNNWLYTVKLPKALELIEFLSKNKIEARPFWVPMNHLPANAKDLYITNKNVSERIYKECISLPCSSNITEEELDVVVDCIFKFYGL